MKIEFLEPIIPTPSDAGRSPGLHVSGLISHLMRTSNLRRYKLASQTTGEDWKRAYSRWEAGFIYEAVASAEYAKRRQAEAGVKCVFQIEVEKDNVFGTIDLLDLGDWSVGEFKYTHLSLKRWREVEALRRLRDPALPKWMWGYELQIKSYVHMVDGEQAQLHMMFGSGDYRGSGPVMKRVRLWWTKEELKRNWALLLKQAAGVSREKRKWVLA